MFQNKEVFQYTYPTGTWIKYKRESNKITKKRKKKKEQEKEDIQL